MTEPLDGAGPGQATEVRCLHCEGRVLLAHADRGEARKQIFMHLIRTHDGFDGHGVILEGEDFLCEPAPYRCDLCLVAAEPPWWTYMTPPTAEFPVQDPGWLVCDGCHEIISSQPRPMRLLVERSLRQQLSTFILDSVPQSEIRSQLTRTMRGFLDHIVGEPVRSEP